jgi:hypothetical protein
VVRENVCERKGEERIFREATLFRQFAYRMQSFFGRIFRMVPKGIVPHTLREAGPHSIEPNEAPQSVTVMAGFTKGP